MESHWVRVWLTGGWGVDALLGSQTRDHHDLDVLVEVADLERFIELLGDLGFERAYVWEGETSDVHHPSWSTSGVLPTAFVSLHRDGREVDRHVFGVDEGGDPSALWNPNFALTREGLEACGVVAGEWVRCPSPRMQRLAHAGYELPPHQVEVLRRLAVACRDP